MHGLELHIIHVIKYNWEWLQSIPTSSWVAVGSLLSTGVGAVLLTSLNKKIHLNRHEIELAKHWVALIVSGWSLLLTYASAVIMYGHVNPNFLGTHTVEAVGIAYFIYNVGGSQGSRKFIGWLKGFQKLADEYGAEVAPAPTAVQTTPVLESPETSNPLV